MIKNQTLGFQLKRDEADQEKFSYDDMRKRLNDSLKRAFRPEFINRLDSIVIFRSLNKEDIEKIVTLELDKVAERLKEHSLTLTATEAALSSIADEGYDPEFGARPLRRVIQQRVEDTLSDRVLAGEFNDGDSVLVDVDPDGNIILIRAEEKTPDPVI
jgi:ATP-dependent Clp protease ATP-binding subunit ClpC